MALIINGLELLITGKCNLRCPHCMRGESQNVTMSDKTIENALNNVKKIKTLNISGGEPLLALDKILKIMQTIIERQIEVRSFNIFANGTLYTSELSNWLDNFKRLISEYQDYPISIKIMLSKDQFHKEEMEKATYQNSFENAIFDLMKSPYCAILGLKTLDRDGFKPETILLNEGNARKLNLPYSQSVHEYPTVTFQDGFDLHIGPLVCINPWRTVTNCDASFENQQTKYNYGNINEQDLGKILAKTTEFKTDSYSNWYKMNLSISQRLY